MAEKSSATGNRDDLAVDVSRCLPMRFSGSSCRRCIDVCPHGAVALDSGLAINPHKCRGCLLCTAACPVGALEQKAAFSACLAQLSRVSEPVLGCTRRRESSNALLACLGGLSEEHLMALCHTLPGTLAINLSGCADCSNKEMILPLRQRLASLSQAGLLNGGCRIVVVEAAAGLRYHEESLNRRGFFRSLSTALFQSAAVIISNSDEQVASTTPYREKRLPMRREILNRIRKLTSPQLVSRIRERFDSDADFNGNCTKCHACINICPTGALQAGPETASPAFDQDLCSGCELCSEFCLDEAVRILPARVF